MEAFGVAGTVISIVDIIARSVLTLHDLRRRTNEAEVTVSILISQLSTIRAALDQIHRWTDECLQDDMSHYQLIIDLGTSLDSCKLLISLIDSQLSKLEWKESDQLSFESKIRVVLNEQSTRDCLTYLNHQISALNLLLTAFKCRTPSDQRNLLEDEKSRETLDQVKDDSSSLIVLYDNASISRCGTATTTTTSKFSIRFGFDAELLKAKAYQSSFRSLMRRHKNQPVPKHSQSKLPGDAVDRDGSIYFSSPTSMPTSTSDPKNSKKIDRMLQEDGVRLRKEITILALGGSNSGTKEVVRQMKMTSQGKYTSADLAHFRHLAAKRIIQSLRAELLDLENDAGDRLDDADKEYAKIISKYDLAHPFQIMPEDVGIACKALWETIKKSKRKEDDYFLDSITRILRPEYTPSHKDIFLLQERAHAMLTEAIFRMGQLQMRVIEINNDRYVHRKVLHQFQNVTAILFAVDLLLYDQPPLYDNDLTAEDSSTRLSEILAFFDSIVNSPWFANSSVILFFSNVAAFKAKLETVPLVTFFPDYSGGVDVHRATMYLLGRFTQVNRNHLDLYLHLIDHGNAANINLVSSAVNDTILRMAM